MSLNIINRNSKIVVIGTSGAGKTTVARTLARKFCLKDIELDALFWEPNWTETSPEIFRSRVSQAISESPSWIAHGNYSKVRDLIWSNASVLIWLDFPRSIVLWRVIKRSMLRIFKREILWAGNRESFRKTFFSRDSIILYTWRRHPMFRQWYSELITSSEASHLKVLKFSHPNELSQFLEQLGE